MFTTLIQMTLWLASKWWLWLAVLAKGAISTPGSSPGMEATGFTPSHP